MIRYGDKNSDEVRTLQKNLERLGIGSGGVDGDFGDKTLKGWKQFKQTYLDDYKVVSQEEFEKLAAKATDLPDQVPTDDDDKTKFIRSVKAIALEVMKKTGLPASVSVGQSIVETEYGKSKLAREALNYHGIKAGVGGGKSWPTSEFPEWSGKVYQAKDDEPGLSRFMLFENISDSFWSHDRWFCYHKHYHQYFKYADNPREFLRRISPHYATDESYFNKVWAAIERHNLISIDKEITIDFEHLASPWRELHAQNNEPVESTHFEFKPDQGTQEKEVLLWYPEAFVPQDFKQITRDKYKNGYPQGAVVHWIMAPRTGGRDKAVFWARWANKEGEKNEEEKIPFVFFTIGNDGSVVQSFPLDRWGNHAGPSFWEGLGTSVGECLVGIEVVCEGRVTKFEDGRFGHKIKNKDTGQITWRYVETEDVRYIEKNTDNICAGYYQKYTEKQEEALINLLLWLKKNNPGVFNLDLVLGHDEVAGPSGLGKVDKVYESNWRKTDPGGSLSMTMPRFREFLKSKYEVA